MNMELTVKSQSYVTTDGQSASLSWCLAPHLGPKTRFLLLSDSCGFVDVRTGLSFTIAAGPRQRSHSRVWVPRDSWPHFTASDLRLIQPGGPGPCIYIPQEQGGPVVPPGTGFPFHRLLQLARLRWRYSKSPPRGIWLTVSRLALLITSRHGPRRKHASHYYVQLLHSWKHACLRRRYLATAVVYLLISRLLPSSGSTCHNISKIGSSMLLEFPKSEC
jgi:hypothetical protein